MLGALAALVKENPPVAGYLGRGAGLEGESIIDYFLVITLTSISSHSVSLLYYILLFIRYSVYRSTTCGRHTGTDQVAFRGRSTRCLSLVCQFFFSSFSDRSHRFASTSITHMIRAGAFTPPSGSMPTSSPITHPSTSSSIPSSSPHPSLYGSSSSSSFHGSRASTSTAPANGQGLSFVNTHSSQSNTYQSYASLEEACTRTVINVFCRLMALPLTGAGNAAMGNTNVPLAEGIDSDAALIKTKACFTLRECHFCDILR